MEQERNQSNTSLPKTSDPAFPSDDKLAEFQKISKIYSVSNQEKLLELWRVYRQGSNSKNGRIKKLTFFRYLKSVMKPIDDSIPIYLFKSRD